MKETKASVNEFNTNGNKELAGRTDKIQKFLIIFLFVFVSQIPGCFVVLADDAGQINYFEYENVIELSKTTFCFPLKLLFDSIGSGSLLIIYFGNLLLLTVLTSLLLLVVKKLWQRISGQPTTNKR